MGGKGSGAYYHWWRHPKKTTVEECRALGTKDLRQLGLLKADSVISKVISWGSPDTNSQSSILVKSATTVPNPCLCLEYTLSKTGENVRYTIALSSTRPPFGGHRWWLHCPLIVSGRRCDRRGTKLYLPPGARYFGCRECYSLTYRSCQESHKYDAFFAEIAQGMGCDIETAKFALEAYKERYQ